jgi:hypothetical protein
VDLLTWLLLVFGFGFAICLQLLVNMTGDLSQGSEYEAPAILETPAKTAAASNGRSRETDADTARDSVSSVR